jgi:hypothetical protein
MSNVMEKIKFEINLYVYIFYSINSYNKISTQFVLKLHCFFTFIVK